MTGQEAPLPLVSLSEVQSFCRLEAGDEDALAAGLIRTASSLCEQFVGHALIEREFSEQVAATGRWQRLSAFPVRSISEVSTVDPSGVSLVIPTTDYSIDIDTQGRGWVRCDAVSGGRGILLRGRAGLAKDVNGVPEPLRQGVLRLVAHLLTNRDGAGGEPPAAVTALWRPFRRMSLTA